MFDVVERGVGVPLEAVVRSERFFDAMTAATRTRSTVRDELERLSRRTLHLLNLPTATDVRRMSDQMARMERRMVSMYKSLDDDYPG